MPSLTISQNEQGQMTITLDGAEPQPIEGVEQACQVVQEVFGGQEQESPAEDQQEGAGAAFEQGFGGVRNGGLNA